MRRSNNPAQIANRRLVNEHLVNPELKTAVEVVATLGAVQAQDYGGSKWALSQRAIGLTDVAIEDDISTGRIVRTHVLRPTWHFVAAADIRWMLRLTAPRVHMANAYSYRYHELDEAVFRKSRRALTRALEGGKHLTREELAAAMKAARINIDDRQRVAHLMMNAELDGLICSGARRGKQFTYSLLDERVPAGEVFSRDEALSELAKRFFSTRGPATLDDFAWWSGLTKTDARRGALAAASAVVEEKIEGRSYYSAADERKLKRSANLAHLLPNYDEYFVGFKDRGAMVHRLRQKGLNPRTDALFGHVLTINGQVVGGWTRSLTPREVRVTLRIVDKLSRPEERAIDKAVKQFAGFLGRQARVV
ncbi:MAG TPA: winged helix DNA-binding domain-containing protein [Gemmatimonadaceae bacterium]|nr:winged helix DNA-binding domain-containing protein [Gemmatimonadaceae bacterium]